TTPLANPAAPAAAAASSTRASRDVGIERLRRLLEPTSPALVRAACGLAMGASAKPGGLPHLVTLANDSDALVRRAALRARASHDSGSTIRLVLPLLSDPDGITRSTAAGLLATHPGPAAPNMSDADGPVLAGMLAPWLEGHLALPSPERLT